jgi:hypothetical protein
MFTLQNGTFQLAGGAGPVANGSVVLTLSNPGATVIATGAAATPSYVLNLDAFGNIAPGTQVFGNAELTPPGTFYTAQLFTGPNGTGTLISTSTWSVGPSAPYSGSLYPSVMVLPAVSFVGAVIFPSVTVAFSATPTFAAGSASKFYLTLTGSVTSSSISGMVKDQIAIFQIAQDGTGGRSFVWPATVKNPGPVKQGAGAISVQAFTFDGSNFYPLGPMTYN